MEAYETNLCNGHLSVDMRDPSDDLLLRYCQPADEPYLRDFIQTFQPERLLPEKDLWLQLEKDGHFAVSLGKNGTKLENLSESDAYVFRFLCFWQLHRFLKGLRAWNQLPAVEYFLEVPDFSDRLDESVDYEALLARAENVILF